MKRKKILIRFLLIGALHSTVYLYLIPFIVFPLFGKNVVTFVIIITVLLSLLILATYFINKKK